jgi:hypothetical protein
MFRPYTSVSHKAGRGDRDVEAGRHEDNTDLAAEDRLLAAGIVQPRGEPIPSLVDGGGLDPSEIALIVLDKFVERYRGDHRRIPQALQLA